MDGLTVFITQLHVSIYMGTVLVLYPVMHWLVSKYICISVTNEIFLLIKIINRHEDGGQGSPGFIEIVHILENLNLGIGEDLRSVIKNR